MTRKERETTPPVNAERRAVNRLVPRSVMARLSMLNVQLPLDRISYLFPEGGSESRWFG